MNADTIAITPETPAPPRKIIRLIFFLSLGIFIAACALPAVSGWAGVVALAVGWSRAIGAILKLFNLYHEPAPLVMVAWFANILLFAAWIMLFLARFRAAALLAGLAFLVGLSFILDPHLCDNNCPRVSLELGAYLWLVSMAVVAVGSSLAFVKRSRPRPI